MHQLFIKRLRFIAPAALLILAVSAVPAHAAAPAAHTRVSTQASCAALGTYLVGPRVLPYTAGRATPPAHTSVHTEPAIAVPASILRGTLTLSGYSACGTPTSGSFAVRRAVVGPVQPNRQSAIACLETAQCAQPGFGVISATGTFAQDPLHADAAMYVRVSATLVMARPAPQLGRPCSNNAGGCPLSRVITSTVTMSDVTGYLQVSSGSAAGAAPIATHTATLSFLPPPSADTGLAPDAVVLQGWRGRQPQPVPAP